MKLTRNKRKEIGRVLDKQIENLLQEAKTKEDIDQILSLLEKKQALYKSKLDPNTVAIIVGNLAGICIIVGYEHLNVITSKALSFVIKGRV